MAALDLVSEPKQIPTSQTRPSLLWLEREAVKLQTVTASNLKGPLQEIQIMTTQEFWKSVNVMKGEKVHFTGWIP